MQWNIILFLVFALVIAAFAVTNIDAVTVNYLFGEASVPLILVIIGFTLAGAVMVVSFNLASQIKQHRTIKNLQHENTYLKEKIAEYEQQYQAESSVQYVDDEQPIVPSPEDTEENAAESDQKSAAEPQA